MFSPIKHLKFALDSHTQKTVAYLENKEENEVKKKKNSSPATKTKAQIHTKRLTGIQIPFILQFGNE